MKEDTQWEKLLKEASDRALSTVYFPEKSKTKMEDTKETAALLLKEWKKLKMDIDMDKWTLDHPNHFSRKFVIENMGKADVLSRRLDEMCEAAGISIIQGHFVYAKCVRGDAAFGGWFGAVVPENWARIPAREQQAIQEWLLIKNENTKSNA